MKRQFRLVAFVLALSFILPMNMVGSLFIDEVEAAPVSQIASRGLVFNTGVSSDQIRLLKDFFRARGDKNVPWGYAYDGRTKELVRSFQREKGLGADGIAGQGTLNKVNQEIREKGYNIGLRQPSVNAKGDLIVINKSSNTLYHMKNGRVYKSYPVATGKTPSLTPNGKHRVVVKYINPAWRGIPGGAPNNPLGKRWIGLSVGGGGTYGMHGNSNAKSIGTYASLGCVRMFNPDVEKFYREVAIGTPVWIGPESSLEKYGVSFKETVSNSRPTSPAKPKDKYIVQKNAKVTLDGELIDLKDPILNSKGTTYYPFREILEKTGSKVSWNNKDRIAIAESEDTRLEIEIDTGVYSINGKKFIIEKDKKPFIRNGKTYIPIRNIMEALGFKVDWDQQTTTIILKSPNKDEEPDDKNPDKDIKISLDGELISLKDPIVNIDSRNYYPFKETLEAVGGKVVWDGDREVAIGNYDGKTIEIGRTITDYVILDGERLDLPEGQKVFINKANGKTYMPLAFIMESLGFKVEWDGDTNTIVLVSPANDEVEEPSDTEDIDRPEDRPDQEEPEEESIEENPIEDK